MPTGKASNPTCDTESSVVTSTGTDGRGTDRNENSAPFRYKLPLRRRELAGVDGRFLQMHDPAQDVGVVDRFDRQILVSQIANQSVCHIPLLAPVQVLGRLIEPLDDEVVFAHRTQIEQVVRFRLQCREQQLRGCLLGIQASCRGNSFHRGQRPVRPRRAVNHDQCGTCNREAEPFVALSRRCDLTSQFFFDRLIRFTLHWMLQRQNRIQDATELVDVRASVGISILFNLLRCHVTRRPSDLTEKRVGTQQVGV